MLYPTVRQALVISLVGMLFSVGFGWSQRKEVKQSSGIFTLKQSPLTLNKTRKSQKSHSDDLFLIPLSYTATKGEGRAQGGVFDYFDNTGIQLIDGIVGGNDIFSSFYDWVGWGIAHPVLRFMFPRQVKLRRVEIHFNRNDRAAIELPTQVTINGKVYKVRVNQIADRTSGFVYFDGSFSGHEVLIQVIRGKGWVFIDEVRFVRAK